VTVTARNTIDPSVSISATINLNPITVSVSPTSVQLQSGQTRQFSAAVTDTSNTAVTWSISPATGSISTQGLYTAPSSISSQQVVIVTATSAADPTKKATATVTLSPQLSVSISPTSVSLAASQTRQFTASVSGTTNTAVTWSLNPTAGTVSASGLYTAPVTISTLQSVTLTATSVADPTKKSSATITLNPPAAPVSVSLSPTSVTLNPAQTRQFTATVANSSNTSVTWSLSSAVGSISNAGLYTAPASVATPQTVTVKATSVADTSKFASALVTLNPSPSTSNPQASFSFNEGSGKVANDSSGDDNHGTITGATWTSTAKFGRALRFDGSSDYVRVNDSNSLDLAQGTIEAWVRLLSLNRWHGVIGKGSVNDDGRTYNYAIEINNTNRIVCVIGNGSRANTVTSKKTMALKSYTHLACTFDGASLKLYVNGSLDASVPIDLSPINNSSPVHIGQYGGNVDRLHGMIDEVRIYSRARSQSEIQQDMNQALVP
jgi:hypothetical protein